MHDNFLKLYMDKERATIDNITTWYYKILTRKVEKLIAMEPDRTFGLDYIFSLFVETKQFFSMLLLFTTNQGQTLTVGL